MSSAWLPAGWRARATNEVVIVSARLSALPISLEAMRERMAADELARIARLQRPVDATRSLLGHSLAREMLGDWLHCAPVEVPLHRDPSGRPVLWANGAPCAPFVSIAHSGDTVLAAFNAAGRVGVDVERVQVLSELMELAKSVLRPDELAALAALPREAQLEAFYRVWTRKEATLKGLGVGLSGLSLLSCCVMDRPDNALVAVDLPGEYAESWQVHSITLDGAPENTPETAAVAFEHAESWTIMAVANGR